MKNILLVFILIVSAYFIGAQSGKEAKKLRIKSVTESNTIGDKTLFEKKTVFDKNGDHTEETDYNKEGIVKKVTKFKRNADGKVTEELEYNSKNELKREENSNFQ